MNPVEFAIIGYSKSGHAPQWSCPPTTLVKTEKAWNNLCKNSDFPKADVAAKVNFSKNDLLILSSGTCDGSHVIGIAKICKTAGDNLQVDCGQVDLNPGCRRNMMPGFSHLYIALSKNLSLKSIHLNYLDKSAVIATGPNLVKV